MNKYYRDRALQMPHGETLPYDITHRPEWKEDADLRSDGNVYLRLRAEAGTVHEVEAICLVDDEPSVTRLTRRYEDSHEEVWESDPIPLNPHLQYFFRLQTVTGQALLGRMGLQASIPKEARFSLENQKPVDVPDWARGATFYQIFPDRFCRTTPVDGVNEPWWGEPTITGFKGGTLRGITSKLDYLAELGIDALWLNPVFSSPSNHRYDTTDFYTVDERLGTNDDLCDLTQEAHARGMRVILDGVFNHVSEEHPFFQDVKQNGERSPYWDWFNVRSWPIKEATDAYYATWWGFGHLPQLDLSNSQVEQYFLRVGTHWIREVGIDGWRLDVASEVPLTFWRRFRNAIRGIKPEAYLLAEVWGDSRPFVQGDSFDATMNYPFRRAVLEFLRGRINARACARHLNRLYYRLQAETAEVQYNLLGSHDVSRVRHDLEGDLKMVELAFAIQFAYPGIAAVYYGDELGLDGGGDPGCRKAFPWQDEYEDDLRGALSCLTALRRDEIALRTGSLYCEELGENTLQIQRVSGQEKVVLTVDRIQRSYSWTVGE